MKGYLYIMIAIILEVLGASMLKLSEGFTMLTPTLILIGAYCLSFLFLILALKTIALSVGYSIWAGVGTVGTAFVGYFFFKESLSLLNLTGLVIIIVGVILLNIATNEVKQVNS